MMLKQISSITAASVVAMTFVVAGEAKAATFTQTQTALEQDLNNNFRTDPLVFTFSDLAPVKPGETSFKLELLFTELDLTFFLEFLGTSIDSSGTNYNLGIFPLTVTSGDIYNSSGFGNLSVDFSSIGGTFFSDPFQVTLTPSFLVNPYSPIGSASLTLSYEAVPEPETITGLVVVAMGGAALRRGKSKKAISLT